MLILSCEIFVWGNLYTPAFLKKSAEEIDWKGIVEHPWSKERQRVRKSEGDWFQNGKSRRDRKERRDLAGLGSRIHKTG